MKIQSAFMEVEPKQGRLTMSLIAGAAALALAGCAAAPVVAPGTATARTQLTQLQSSPQLATMAPTAMKEAEQAVAAAEVPQKDPAEAEHLAYLANSKVEYAEARAQTAYMEQQRAALAKSRDQIQLDARTAEAEQLRQQLAELDAQKTDRGLVMTLGDVMFDTGKATLRPGAVSGLTKLATFLQEHPERTVQIEGHTDSVGSESSNMLLSQKRADAVANFLIGKGISATRLHAVGKGEGFPVASNDTATGRQQNRRVEVIISES